MSKLELFIDVVVNEYCCDWNVFCENVDNTETLESFRKKWKSCKTRDDVRNLVSQYI